MHLKCFFVNGGGLEEGFLFGGGSIVFCFLMGSIPFGYLVGRLRGIDLREYGSCNIGATNAWRVLGAGYGLVVFIADFGKGLISVSMVQGFVGQEVAGELLSIVLLVSGLAAILGHNYTPWLGFYGGKGIATTAGVLAAVMPWTLVASFSVWLLVLGLTRYVSVGSIAASLSLPIATLFFYPEEKAFFIFALLAGLLGIYRHRVNIVRLWRGEEAKMRRPSSSSTRNQ